MKHDWMGERMRRRIQMFLEILEEMETKSCEELRKDAEAFSAADEEGEEE